MTRVLLVGAMATGKSSVGRLLAERLGCDYLDNDELLEQRTGCSARELAAREGEPALRAAESQVLHAVLARPAPWVAGVAAGAVLDDADRRRIRDSAAVVAWLRAPAAVLAARVAGAGHRPWLGEDPLPVLERLVRERAPLYAELAHHVVDVSAAEPVAVADDLVRRLVP